MVCSEPESAAPANTSDPGCEYEVFLNFCGPDTGKGFTDVLYTVLTNVGIRTFRGDDIGNNLAGAIEQSKISIPVFSGNYAASNWCLKQLTLMLEGKNERNQMILPVFYDVTPRDVRHQTGSYESAFQQHEKNYDSKIVQGWRKALAEVGGLKGWESKNVADGLDGNLIKLIVSKVLSKLKRDQLPVTETLVGIEDPVDAVKGLLKLGTNDVRIIGIWGMGGIGKTTLAKVTYNRILDGFECRSFIRDIREKQRRKGLGYVQSLLISDFSGCECKPFRNVEEGISEIKDRYRDKRVLILLDDVDHADQLDALLIRPDSFGRGSRIITTTRNRDVLEGNRVGYVYEAKELNDDNALELFQNHAFKKDSSMEELIPLSGEIVKTTGGLPLAIEVIGSYLSGKKKEIWKATLEKLKTVPHMAVQETLRISYEALEREGKEIFLDIACFFIEEDIDGVFEMWEDCEFFPVVGVNVLLTLSLIKIRKDEYSDKIIWMHDQLRDLGRDIIRQENHKEPGKRSRLWSREEAKDVVENQKGSAKVKAIRVELDLDEGLCLRSEHFRSLSNLKFLELDDNVTVDGDFEKLLPNLRWFRWPYAAFDSVTNLQMPNLVFLSLYQTNLTDDWKGWSSIEMNMKKLKGLYLIYCYQIKKTPDFSAFPNLERLTLQLCENLEVIDPSIGELKNLTYLNLSGCGEIKELPPEVGSLGKLKTLDLKGCFELQNIPALPSSLKVDEVQEKSGLKLLDIGECKNLKELADLSNLKFLKHLKANGCRLLEELVGLNKLTALESLNINGCEGLTCLANLSDLKLLRRFSAERCVELQELVGLDQLIALEELSVSECQKLERLPDLSNLKSLRYLKADGCEKLEQLVGLDELTMLERLYINGCKGLMQLPNLSNLKLLRFFSANDCIELQELFGVDELIALEELSVSRCQKLERLPNLSNLKLLKDLKVDGCEKLGRLDGLDKLNALESLNIHGCKGLTQLSNLSNLKMLRCFDARECLELEEVEGLDELTALEELSVSECPKLKRLPELSKLKLVGYLKVNNCEKLEQLVGLDQFTKLERLNVDGCKRLMQLPDLSSLKLLRFFSADGCTELKELVGLDKMIALEELSVSQFKKLERFPDMSNLKSLRYLKVSGCEKLEELVGLDQLTALEVLYMNGCKGLTQLPSLSNLKLLINFFANGCTKLQELVGLGELIALKELSISKCQQLERLPDLSNLKALSYMDADECEKLEELVGVGELIALVTLHINGCKGLMQLTDLSSLKSLRFFSANNCTKLQKLIGLDKLVSLEDLSLSECQNLDRLPDLSNLKSLTHLKVDGCEKLEELAGLDELKRLEKLSISGCKSITTLPDLSKLKWLLKVEANGCEKLQELAGINELKNLQSLSISGCIELRTLPSTSTLQNLRRLVIPDGTQIYDEDTDSSEEADFSYIFE